MSRPIGYYVHHHGAGHRTRAMAIADRAHGRITPIGTGFHGCEGSTRPVDLPDDRSGAGFEGQDGESDRPQALHYAPLDHDGIRRRVAAMTTWIARARPALMVIDVSCEVAMLARLASVPTVYVRLGGRRDDQPHREAFRSAKALLCPFAAALDDPMTPEWVRAKTRYLPGLVPRPAARPIDPDLIVVILGRGGAGGDAATWVRAACAVGDRRWCVIGDCLQRSDIPANLAILGWRDDADAWIAQAAVVVGSAGDGVVGAVLAARRPFICVPEDRPFEEQHSKARQLASAGAAILCDTPTNADWQALIVAAIGLDLRRAALLDDPDGPDRAAAWLIACADDGAGA